MEAPQRKYRLTLDLGADSMEAICNVLSHLEYRLSAEPILEDQPHYITSGGYDSGYNLKITIDHDMDHDKYVKQLEAYLESEKQEEERGRIAEAIFNPANDHKTISELRKELGITPTPPPDAG